MTPGLTDNRTKAAVLAITLSVCALSLGDALIKGTSLSLPLWQMFILRSAFTLLPLWWLARWHGPMKPRALIWIVLRSVLLVLMWLSYYAALPIMPLSFAAAVYYTGPLMIVALASAVSRTWPALRVVTAIALGFVGVMLIIRPDAAAFDVSMLLPAAAALFYACAMVLTSAKCSEENPFILALALNLAFIVCGVILSLLSGHDGSFLFGAGQPLDLHMLAVIAALALLILVGSVGAAFAYQNGPPATVAAFDYSYLVFSLAWGGLFFGEIAGLIAIAGIGIITGAGLLALPRARTPHVGVGANSSS